MGSRRLFSLCAEHPAAMSGYRRWELSNGAAFWARFLNLDGFFVEIEQQKRPEAQTAPRKGRNGPGLAGARCLPAFAPPALGACRPLRRRRSAPAGARPATAPAGAPNSLTAAPG